jgi:hypothetical protein
LAAVSDILISLVTTLNLSHPALTLVDWPRTLTLTLTLTLTASPLTLSLMASPGSPLTLYSRPHPHRHAFDVPCFHADDVSSTRR